MRAREENKRERERGRENTLLVAIVRFESNFVVESASIDETSKRNFLDYIKVIKPDKLAISIKAFFVNFIFF